MKRIKKMIEDGFAVKRISHKLNLKFKEVQKYVKENSLSIKKETFSDDKIEYIIQLYKDGVSAKNLGLKYSIDKRRVQKWARSKDVERTRGEAHRFTFFNENYFDNIDTPSKAYWLGFFYADAYNSQSVSSVIITLGFKDHNHLVKLAAELNYPKSKLIKGCAEIDDKKYDTISIKLHSKHMCSSLAKQGCPQNKSFIIKYPEWLRSDLNKHFIRGLFDGDGCLSLRKKQKEWKWSLASTKEMCESINSIISKELDFDVSIYYISKTDNNTYEMQTSGNEKIHSLMKWLYTDSTDSIRLNRKFKKYEELIEQQNNRNINRDNYLLSEEKKNKIINSKETVKIKADEHNVHSKTVLRLKNNSNKFIAIPSFNGQKMTAKFIKTLSKEERCKYVNPLFDYFRNQGWIYPTVSEDVLKKTWKKLCNYQPDLSTNEIFNNSSLGTNICKHFCHSFCEVSDPGKPNMIDLWNDDEFLKKLIRNRLVINWESGTNETFNISHRMMIQGMRSMRAVPSTTMFKPIVAKYICMKYSSQGDLVGDYSAGFGGRMLGATSCGRRYLGIDPLTIPELQKMSSFFDLDAKLIHSGSEEFRGEENSLDLCYSSPPYYDQEYYSDDISQAYNRGEDYFYNIYWKNTLLNMKHMLKPKKRFGLNVKNYPKMLNMARDLFGQETEKVGLRTVRSHLNKSAGIEKYEYIYMFINNK